MTSCKASMQSSGGPNPEVSKLGKEALSVLAKGEIEHNDYCFRFVIVELRIYIATNRQRRIHFHLFL